MDVGTGGAALVTVGIAGQGRGSGRRRLPPVLTAAAVLVSVAVLVPLVFLVVQAVQVGWAQLHQLLFRSLTATLIWNTVSLVVVVTALCAVVGTLAAWFVERTDVPCRRLLAILVVIPLGIPDFVVSFGWRAVFPGIGGFWAAVLVMTLAVYPLVFLPVAASLRAADPAQEEVARSLGLGRVRTFWTVTVGSGPPCHFRGSDPGRPGRTGRVRRLRDPGVPDPHDRDLQRVPSRVQHSCRLCALADPRRPWCVAARQRGHHAGPRPDVAVGRGRSTTAAAAPARPAGTRGLRWSRASSWRLALGVPVGAIVFLIVQGGSSTLPAASSLPDATLNTFGYAAAAGVLATLAGAADRPLVGAFPAPEGAQPGTLQLGCSRGARAGHRSEPDLS